ncbi:EAL domain-containing protein [Wenzhouxiangella sediminis]|uniref:cyclic-guanylate-specific phosphodiesterase n=1 Tax=Wenzhouxiangella sediminis TaxID=1792836 RepID=A0A3E1K685_9GAMM|nr:EAL domain-containing protein [Wenzhouxiangella sediminis]RFF29478.1 EAL domain-containing protein [Wenzhouxiangella sediminis]
MRRALIVDDHEENRYLLRSLLSANGFEISEAENGALALDRARREPPDIVISDLLMPTMDGYTLLREWKADRNLSAIPFIVYTATYTQSEDERLARDLGADAFLIKPTEPEVFLKRIEAVLDQAGSQSVKVREPRTSGPEAERRYSQALVRKLEDRSAELARRVEELQSAKAQIERLNRLYSALSAINQLIVHTRHQQDLLEGACRIAVERGGFTLAWVGLLTADGRTIEVAARHGGDEGIFDQVGTFTLEQPFRTPVEIAVGENRVFLSNDLLAEARLAELHPVFERFQLKSAAACPLHANGQLRGALCLYAAETGFFDAPLTDLIGEVSSDISYAMDNYHRESLHQAAEASLKSAEEFNRLSRRAIEASPNGVMITAATPEAPIIYVNAAFERITGFSREEAMGRNPRFLYGEDRDQRGLSAIRSAIRNQREGEAVIRYYRKDGTLFWNELTLAPVLDEEGVVTHFVSIINDITERKQYEEQLEKQYSQDTLTELASRNLLRDRTEQAITAARYDKSRVALLFIDLDQFKRINDSLGRSAGDEVLREAGNRLRSAIGPRETAARLSGDEFVVMVQDIEDAGDLPGAARSILESLEKPFHVAGREMNISASIGISVFPDNGEDYDTLLRNADIAMYRAKQMGANQFRYYTEDMNASALRRIDMESRLRRAVENRDMQLFYQPVISLETNRVVGAEALLRWHDNEKWIGPDDFIPLAEETGLIIPLGKWVLEEATRQVRTWLDDGIDLRVAINLSARQFRDPQLGEHIVHALDRSGAPADRLRLEITESVVMDSAEEAARILGKLQSLGLEISIDDFGTGYSSLAYLRRFPIDQFKIDRSFIQELGRHNESEAIVIAIIRLARSLGLGTVAEGVETESQRDYLSRAGCDLVQGFFYSKPLPAEDFARWFADYSKDNNDKE